MVELVSLDDLLAILLVPRDDHCMDQVVIEVQSDDTAADLRSLLAWLSREEGLRGRVRLRQEPAAERMGGAADALVIALTSGGTVTVVARAVQTWLVQRKADITIKTDGTIDGKRISAKDMAELVKLVKSLDDEPS
ncbi:hypothetical protein AB0C18_14345 [Nonomuraea muscovyensis]|uniref:effector-associated constant component EACC1 n=1 Tax=Nonomuraea muscovyensis TaxID=1124761 RepID=UPI003403E083